MISYQRLNSCMSTPEAKWFWSKFELTPDDPNSCINGIYKGYLKKNRQRTFIVPNKNDKISAELSLRIIPDNVMTHHHETRGYRIALLNNIQTVSFAALLDTVMVIETEKANRGNNQLLSEKEIAAKLTKLKALNDYDLYLTLLPELAPRKLLSELRPLALDNDIKDSQLLFEKTDKNKVYHFTVSYNTDRYLRLN